MQNHQWCKIINDSASALLLCWNFFDAENDQVWRCHHGAFGGVLCFQSGSPIACVIVLIIIIIIIPIIITIISWNYAFVSFQKSYIQDIFYSEMFYCLFYFFKSVNIKYAHQSLMFFLLLQVVRPIPHHVIITMKLSKLPAVNNWDQCELSWILLLRPQFHSFH